MSLNEKFGGNTEKGVSPELEVNREVKDESKKNLENNVVQLVGKLVSDFTYSHEVCGEGFYIVELYIERLSGIGDVIPLMVSEKIIDVTKSYTGKWVEVCGQYRSYNLHEGLKNKLKLSVFVREFNLVLDDAEVKGVNQVFLDGFICKEPICRQTPMGRQIADLLVAVNRPRGKSDYIPCIAWGRNALYVSRFEVGGKVRIHGRIQSREYMKKLSEGEVEKRVAYEISVVKLEYEKN